jgi:hypothetical protein
MEEFKVRMLEELHDLSHKITKVVTFIKESNEYKNLSFKNKFYMARQCYHMKKYHKYLMKRIDINTTQEEIDEYNQRKADKEKKMKAAKKASKTIKPKKKNETK